VKGDEENPVRYKISAHKTYCRRYCIQGDLEGIKHSGDG